jgi:hypothetical protein
MASTTMNDTNENRRRNLGFFFDETVRRLPDKVPIIDLFGGRERLSTYERFEVSVRLGGKVSAALARQKERRASRAVEALLRSKSSPPRSCALIAEQLEAETLSCFSAAC